MVGACASSGRRRRPPYFSIEFPLRSRRHKQRGKEGKGLGAFRSRVFLRRGKGFLERESQREIPELLFDVNQVRPSEYTREKRAVSERENPKKTLIPVSIRSRFDLQKQNTLKF